MSGGKIEDESGKTFLNDIQPLLQALDVLTNFASSAEFASIPAKISDQVNVTIFLSFMIEKKLYKVK